MHKELEFEVEVLREKQQSQDQTIQQLQSTVQKQADAIAWLKEEIKVREDQLAFLRNSRAWRAIQVYRDARRKLGRKVQSMHPEPSPQKKPELP